MTFKRLKRRHSSHVLGDAAARGCCEYPFVWTTTVGSPSAGGIQSMISAANISIVQELRLPCFDCAPGTPLMAYPLPQPNFAVEFVNSIPPDTFDWRNWHEDAQAEERQRAREEREAAEAKEANQVAVG